MPLALLSAAAGLGDILRATPLVRVLVGLGYEVDLLLAPDYPGTVALLESAPEVRRLFYVPGSASSAGESRTDGLEETNYDTAVFTYWAHRLRPRARAVRTHSFDRSSWLAQGDSTCVERMARELGWTGEMPAPFAVHSGRKFDEIAAGTVALHPGCKGAWPWKKWHGFPELAAELPRVVVVGTEEDRRTGGTYFERPFEWPPHVRDLTGALSLPDTAALLSQCAALVSNDSGLMHLGVALDIPVFGVFGITSPAREAIPAPNMLPITGGLPCETACRRQPWGRRDCHRHLECLRTLTGREVADRIRATLPQVFASEAAPGELPPAPIRSRPMTDLSLAYYGYVSDHSGYGHTARAYVHALHRAGVQVRVVDLTRRHAVTDPLVASLMGRHKDPDIHLFHGIPPQWAQHAFKLKNALGMTVWETDSMPSQWRNALNHVKDVWLPCAFNVETFAKDLETPIFRLPHPVFPPLANGDTPDPGPFLRVTDDEFVFYAIFEWQDRKGPHETIAAYLSAFTSADRTALVLKTNPGAAEVARRAVQEARARRRSDARVEVRAEAWSEAGIEALHRRGNCYVSLHRGEGWGYPLFEAASRGKPVVATAYSGPLDYLDPEAHGLVRWTPAPVRQRYHYYNPGMRWADPDTVHAAELMRRTFDRQEDVRARSASAGERIRATFSLDAVGAAARARLEEVLPRAAPARWRARAATASGAGTSNENHASHAAAPAPASTAATWLDGPVPVEWYDRDYFETGRKSNWDRGYSWQVFGNLFRDTATYLLDLLPEAESYIDAGCAKGFLVRALREQGKDAWGVDGSPWAIEHADEFARPFLLHADVAALELDRSFDVVAAFNLLAHLTEEQALAFLARVRPHVNTAMLATVPTMKPGEEMADNRDPSHVTRQSREWWAEVFLRAGWRQDPLHRVAERHFQQHPLPQRMGWEIFLFAPGQMPAAEQGTERTERESGPIR
jgi:glycosyltransferase involved in cell wall biosynthesis/SAM-dependent methyltransferase